MPRESEEPLAPQQRLRTSTETPVQDFARQRAAIAREEAAARLLDELTELAKLGRRFLEEAINAEQEAERQRGEAARTRQR